MGWLVAIINLVRGAYTALLAFRLKRETVRADTAEADAAAAESYITGRKDIDHAALASDAADARRSLRDRNARRIAEER